MPRSGASFRATALGHTHIQVGGPWLVWLGMRIDVLAKEVLVAALSNIKWYLTFSVWDTMF